jgi:hypothetical protein
MLVYYLTPNPHAYNPSFINRPGIDNAWTTVGFFLLSAGATQSFSVQPNSHVYLYYEDYRSDITSVSNTDLKIPLPGSSDSYPATQFVADTIFNAALTITCNGGNGADLWRITMANKCAYATSLSLSVFTHSTSGSSAWNQYNYAVPYRGSTTTIFSYSDMVEYFASSNVLYWGDGGGTHSVTFNGVSHMTRAVTFDNIGGQYSLDFDCPCTPEYCQWGPWGQWSACVRVPKGVPGYGTTVQVRSRVKITSENFCGGCTGDYYSFQACTAADASTLPSSGNIAPAPSGSSNLTYTIWLSSIVGLIVAYIL